ncbi:bifunctional 5,10-methylene-tetrahydrofolate dehydrogenase/5,10-methylene-tetrahydrofolate cyclohydrolase [candidate division KSB1 bacterium]|nr:MAG: bifunctional 5,10-methylene-tetrahydrofolate dehydrogenase/5,10-methylene-tetrahydrofolate cyclohydrolase [candidate division KSB1 bacterium]
MTKLIDGRDIAKRIHSEVQSEIQNLRESKGISPGLTVVLVGDDLASQKYVSSKAKVSAKLGMSSAIETPPADISEAQLLKILDRLNADPNVHGILVQLPLPMHINPQHIIERIDPRKDVDGLHPMNVGLLCMGNPRFIPCTPFGICELMARSGLSIAGKEVVILGRSNLVGRPLSILFSSKSRYGNATVTLCHSQSGDLKSVCRRADVLVAAIGKRKFVTVDMVKPGAVVIDVGTNPPEREGGPICGDVDFENVSPVVSMITPVPGGVGPMTIAMLMKNTLLAARLQC